MTYLGLKQLHHKLQTLLEYGWLYVCRNVSCNVCMCAMHVSMCVYVRMCAYVRVCAMCITVASQARTTLGVWAVGEEVTPTSTHRQAKQGWKKGDAKNATN